MQRLAAVLAAAVAVASVVPATAAVPVPAPAAGRLEPADPVPRFTHGVHGVAPPPGPAGAPQGRRTGRRLERNPSAAATLVDFAEWPSRTAIEPPPTREPAGTLPSPSTEGVAERPVPPGAGARSGTVPARGAPAAPGRAAAPDPTLARVVELTNAERRRAGAPPLAPDDRLGLAAQRYAAAMASGPCFAHTCGPVPELGARVGTTGYVWTRLVENLAVGQRTPEAVVAAWLASPGHRANLLDPAVTELGLGRADGGPAGVYWVQVLAAPDPAPAPGAGLDPAGAADAVLAQVNAARAAAGVGPLGSDAALATAAGGRAAALASGACPVSDDPGCGPGLADRAAAAGLAGWGLLGEAAGTGQRTPDEAVAAWFAADSRLLLDPRFTAGGAALAGYDNLYWILVLSAPPAAGALAGPS